MLAALAVSTSRIGLIATASTTYTEPFNLARQFASLDHISRGRIGWNIVTSWLATAQTEKTKAQDFYADLKARAAAAGRCTDQALILPGLSPLIASSAAEAQRWSEELSALAHPVAGRQRLSGRFGGHDFSHLPLDTPLTPDDFPAPSTVEAARGRTEVILELVRREKPTLRQLLARLAGARGHHTFAGTPEQVADLMEDWLTDSAADGFNIMPPVLPAMLEVFIAVIPLLQRRGLFRTAYEGETLRAHYGLAEPESQFG